MAFVVQNVAMILLLVVLLAVSGIFSGAETVLLSLSKHDRARMKKSANRLEVLAASLAEDTRSLLTSLLMGNMTCNIMIFVISTLLLHRVQNAAGGWVVLGLVFLPSLLVTYVSDVFPKVVGNINNVRLAPLIAVPVATVVRTMWPVCQAIDYGVMRPVHRLIGASHQPTLTREEVREMLEMSEDQGVIDVSENELLQQVVRFGDLRVRDVMTPRVDMVAFNIKDPVWKLKDLVRKSLLNNVPLYEGQIDNILGVVYAKSVFLERLETTADLRRMIDPVKYVPELQSLDRLLGHFRATQSQMAIVVDEFGGVVGIISLEDVVEQMVGDIYSPQESVSQAVQKVSRDEYLVAGDLGVADWAEAFGVKIEAGRTTTVAGMLAALLQRIPKQGDYVRLGDMTMTVEHVQGRRVRRVRLKLTGETLTSVDAEAAK